MPDSARIVAAEGGNESVLGERYALSEPLGHGGMASVYRARDVELDRLVAVKVLAAGSDRALDYVERLRREARTAASLSHPGVVAVYDIGVSAGNVFVVMEYLEGATVRELLARDGALPMASAVNIAVDVCGALGEAHARGVIHRDISPGNIMICAGRQVKVLDFGIALMADTGSITHTGTVLGTPAYLSPEQARGWALDGRSDIYSLGCCLYEMATGQPPFAGSTPAAFAYQHVHERPPEPHALNPAVLAPMARIIGRAMAKDPADRYGSVEAMATDLARLSEDSTAPTVIADESTRPLGRESGAAQGGPNGPGQAPSVGRELTELDGTRGAWPKRLGLALIAVSVATILVAAIIAVVQ